MGIEVILMVAASLALLSGVTPRVEMFVTFVSLALGLQNGAVRHVDGISVHTTYLTGMISDLGSSELANTLVKRFLRRQELLIPKQTFCGESGSRLS
jgi:uncharacterized membrane protein YoaK (UPF0700 family)